MAKVTNIMATKVALDTVDASTSIRSLSNTVASLTKSWQAQSAELRTAGDYLGSAEAKFDGLSRVIEANASKIEALKDKQASLGFVTEEEAEKFIKLKDTIDSLKAQQNSLDDVTGENKEKYQALGREISELEEQQSKLKVGTVANANAFLKYQRQIDATIAKQASLKAQREKAAEAVDRQKSGVIALTRTMQDQNSVFMAESERLRAEGHEYKAIQNDISGLKEKLTSLKEIQKRENELLAKTKANSGEASEAYAKQQVKVSELGAKIAKTRTEISDLNSKLSHTPHTQFGKISQSLEKLNAKAHESNHIFGKLFSAELLSNGLFMALGYAKEKTTELISAGNEYDITQQKMSATWLTLTGHKKDASDMVDTVNKLSLATGQATDVVDELEQGFYHLHSSKKESDSMTESMLNMADAVGLTGDQIQAVTQDMVNGLSRGKVNAGMLNQVSQYFPMFREQLAKTLTEMNHGKEVTTSDLAEMARQGQISADAVEKTFERMGNGKYKSAVENMMSTMYGELRTIKARVPALIGDVIKPIENMRNPFITAVSKWSTDKRTDSLFKKIGTNIGTQMNRIFKAFMPNSSNASIGKRLDEMLEHINHSITNFANTIIKHKKTIKAFGSSMKDLGKISFNVFITALKMLLPIVQMVFKVFESNPKLFTTFAASVLVANKAVGVFAKGFGALDIVSKIPNKLKTLNNTLGVFSLNTAKNGKNILFFGKTFKELGSIIGGFLKDNWLGLVVLAITSVILAFKELYKHSKKFRNFVNGIANNLKAFAKSVQKLLGKIANNVKAFFNTLHSYFNIGLKAIQGIWNNTWKAINDFITPIWNGIKQTTSSAINAVHGTVSDVLGKISDTWNKAWSGISSFFKGIWKGIKRSAQDGINGVLNIINGGIDGIDSVWKFFTGHETSIHHLKPVHFEQGGIVDRHLSMVNDGAGPDWKELIETPDGKLMMSSERNAILPLEPGTRVYNGAETKAIMNMMGVEHYANGGIVGDVINWGTHELKDFGSWIKDKWDAITKFLKHPLENTKAIIEKAISGPIAKMSNQNMVDLGKGVFNKLANNISDWFKKGLQKAKDEHDAASSGGFGKAPDLKNGAELRDVIKNALQANGLPTSDDYINAWLRQVATESGGNAHAVQPGADPDGDGSGPAIGLLQTKRATFAANAFPGHNDIFNAYDNALAAIHYAKSRYGSNMLGVIGHGHGYANGAIINQPTMGLIGEAGYPEAIVPMSKLKDTRAWSLLRVVMEHFSNGQTVEDLNQPHNERDYSQELINEIHDLKSVLISMLGINHQQLKAIKANNSDPQQRYRQQALDQSLTNLQSFS